ncbi:MAG: phytanoyl-CoA dioxygenase family protein [Collimonas sp.]|uniref:phytanoyl-CoA dioxygenase family protein n=1 Tax=Collimonas sp. TaxID=1963772 RepID=UPI003266F62D
MNAHRFEIDGFAVISQLLTDSACAEISSSLAELRNKGAGSRSLLELSWCKGLAQTIHRHPAIEELLPRDSVAVQCTYFEKSKEQNWLVPAHQDLSIPVRERIDHPALTGWSEKEGSVFVQPPDTVLQDVVAVRLHIDECGPEDGPLRVVAGSHLVGRLSDESVLIARDKLGEVVCPVVKGGALLMKPLLLHASSKAVGNSRRRVLHFVFGPRTLPFGLRWGHVI